MILSVKWNKASTPRRKLRGMRLLTSLLILVSLLGAAFMAIHQLTPAKAAAGDWPMYLHDYSRDGSGTDTIISPSNASQLALDWSFKTGGPIASAPASVGGIVYVGSWDGYEYALNATTGALVWKTFLGQTTAPCYPQLAGVSSGANINNGVIYVGGGDSNFYALDPNTGAILWSVFVGDNTKGWYNWSSPLIYNGYAYVGTASVGDCPLIPGQLLQISLSTHQVVNSYNTVPSGQVGGGIWTSPSIDPSTNTIFVTIGNLTPTAEIVALDATTLAVKSSWSVPVSDAAAAGGDSDFGTSPILFTDPNGDQLLGAINKDGIGYVFNRNNLAAGLVWEKQIAVGGTCPECGDGSVSSAAFGNNTLFMAGGNAVINGKGYKGSVNALDPATGTYLWQHSTPNFVIPALAYSNGLVLDGAGTTLEVLNALNGTRLWSYTTGGTFYAEPTVANGQVFAGSTDDNVYAFGLPSTIPPTPTPDANCPSGWTCQDIGNSSPAGSETVSGTSWSVSGGGTSVGGGSDQFRFESQNASGDTQISAQVVSQQVTTGAAQAGVMIRQSSDPTAPYYAVFAEPNNKVAVQYRTAFGSAPTTVTLANAPALPLYLEIQRVSDQFQAATSTDGVNYTLIPGDTATIPMPTATLAGLAVASGTAGTANVVSYNSVTIQTPGASPNPPLSPTPCPSGWNCADVGNPSMVGDQSLSAGAWTVKGAGAGIQYAADQFHYVWQRLAGDGSISARITSQTNTSNSALAGVMLRQDPSGTSAYYGAFVSPGSGVVVQYRPTSGLRTQLLSGPAGTLPTYLMVARSSGTYCTYTSSDGVNWTYVIGSCVALNLTSPILAGLAVTSASGGTLGIDTFDTVTISTTAPPAPTNCPAGWNCADIGYAAPAGSQSVSSGTWTVLGGGSDIYGTYDQFHYVWQTLAADGVVSAHIASQDNVNIWAKAGVMLRQSTDPGSMYYAALVTPGNGIVVQYRATQGGGAQQSASIPTGTVPTYLMVTRSGNVFSAYTSSDGNTWTLVAGSSVTIAMTGAVLAGLAVSSHDESTLSTVIFDTVTISASLVCPAGWTCADIGSPTPAGTQSASNGTWTVQAGGADIFGTADQFHYIWQQLAGDGSVSAQVVSQTNSSSNAKAGVMLRLSSSAGSPFYDAVVSPGHGVFVQYRKSQGAGAQSSANLTALAVPIYLMVARAGVTFSAYTSSDGINWILVPGSSVTLPNMNGTLLAGIAATSHNTTKLSTVVFTTVNVSTCPLNWNCADIGSPVPSGGQSESSGTWTITAGGNDIWGTSDTFHYVWQQLAGDGVVNAQELTQSNSSTWAKAGVMIRQTADPGSMYYGMFVTPGNGIVVQYRNAQGGNTAQVKLSGTAPVYLLVQRSGATFSAYTSSDGNAWTLVPGSSVTINMTGTVLAGLAVTSHNSNILGTVTMGSVNVSAGSIPVNCPTGWNCADIGSPALAGSQSLNSGTWTIQAAGTDIFGTSDQFHYVWQTLASNGSASARVVSQTNTSSWAKAGVMIRQDSTTSSAYYFAMVTPGNGIVIQYRKAAGAGAQTILTLSGTTPVYLAVARSGTTFTTYTSTDGVNWTAVAGSSVTINMTGTALAGLAATSHKAGMLGAITFDTVSVGATIP
jgi:outer membrane protein assembly factor BamB